MICGVGLLISAPFIYVLLGTAMSMNIAGTFVLMFLGQVFLNMNWAIVIDISLVITRHVTTISTVQWPIL